MLQEAEHGLTSMAMNTARTNGDEHLLVRFYSHPKLSGAKTKEQGRPIYEERDFVEIMQPGNKDSIVRRPATEMDKQRFAEHYKKYQARMSDQEQVEGTLLEEWPGITRAQVEECRYINIRTVEQLANVSDANAQNLMGIQLLKQKAVRYLESSAKEATAEALASANARIDALVERLDEVSKEKEILETIAADKPKRGRPKKKEE